jgi:hypothetical protein
MKNKQDIQSDLDGIVVQVRDAAHEVIKRKNATCYAIGLGRQTEINLQEHTTTSGERGKPYEESQWSV